MRVWRPISARNSVIVKTIEVTMQMQITTNRVTIKTIDDNDWNSMDLTISVKDMTFLQEAVADTRDLLDEVVQMIRLGQYTD